MCLCGKARRQLVGVRVILPPYGFCGWSTGGWLDSMYLCCLQQFNDPAFESCNLFCFSYMLLVPIALYVGTCKSALSLLCFHPKLLSSLSKLSIFFCIYMLSISHVYSF